MQDQRRYMEASTIEATVEEFGPEAFHSWITEERDKMEREADAELAKNGATKQFMEYAGEYHRLAGIVGYRQGV